MKRGTGGVYSHLLLRLRHGRIFEESAQAIWMHQPLERPEGQTAKPARAQRTMFTSLSILTALACSLEAEPRICPHQDLALAYGETGTQS